MSKTPTYPTWINLELPVSKPSYRLVDYVNTANVPAPPPLPNLLSLEVYFALVCGWLLGLGVTVASFVIVMNKPPENVVPALYAIGIITALIGAVCLDLNVSWVRRERGEER